VRVGGLTVCEPAAPNALAARTCSAALFGSLRGRSVDESDDDARASPLEEVGGCLEQRQPETDAQAHVVVQHERARGEDSDQSAETEPLGESGAVAEGKGMVGLPSRLACRLSHPFPGLVSSTPCHSLH